jgi:hypothetical protein
MANDLQVLADGAERSESPHRPPSPWTILAVCLALGGGFVAVSLASPSSTEAVADTTDVILDRPVGDVRAEEMGLSEVVAGFADALVGVAVTGDGSVMHVLWPTGRSVVARDTVGGDSFAFDRSGSYIATTKRDETGSALAAGRFNSIATVATSVTSFAWHDSRPGHLSYTTLDSDGWRLSKTIAGFSSKDVFGEPEDQGRVVAWGDWGYALESDSGVALLNQMGQLRASYPGKAFASTADGWLFMAGEHFDLVSAGGGVVRLEISPQRMGAISTASFSPNNRLLAIAGSSGVLVVPVRGDGEIMELVVDDPRTVVWTADSRFLAIPAENGVSILDLETVNRYKVLEEYAFQSIAVIPTGDP